MDDQPATPVRRFDGSQGLSEKLLRWVIRKQLQAPAALLLEMHRPLAPLAWPTAVLFGGLIAPLFGPDYYERIEALRDPALLDRLLERLGTEEKPADPAERPDG